ncbi:MAG: hypothetical protein AABZ84_05910 [Pseudomonadota bacterium]
MRDCFCRGETPFSSLLYALVGCLDDDIPDEREIGLEAGFVWGALAEACVVYTNLGVTAGMKQGIERANASNQTVEYRQLDEEQWPAAPEPRCVPMAPGPRRETQVVRVRPGDPHTDVMCLGCGDVVRGVEHAVEIRTRHGYCYAHERCREAAANEIKKSLYGAR